MATAQDQLFLRGAFNATNSVVRTNVGRIYFEGGFLEKNFGMTKNLRRSFYDSISTPKQKNKSLQTIRPAIGHRLWLFVLKEIGAKKNPQKSIIFPLHRDSVVASPRYVAARSIYDSKNCFPIKVSEQGASVSTRRGQQTRTRPLNVEPSQTHLNLVGCASSMCGKARWWWWVVHVKEVLFLVPALRDTAGVTRLLAAAHRVR